MTIKARSEDFIVQECVGADTLAAWGSAEAGTYSFYRLDKTGIDTPRALDDIARTLGLLRGDVASAGLKDRHAQTSQYISIRVPASRDLPREASRGSWSIRHVGFASEEISSAAIAFNRFRITIRQLTREGASDLVRRAWRFSPPSLSKGSPERPASSPELLIVNYFGAQRFGSARHGRGFAARCLISGRFEQALRLLVAMPMRGEEGRYRQFHSILERHWGDWPKALEKLPQVPERRAIELLAERSRQGFLEEAAYLDAFKSLPYFVQQISVEAYQSWLWNETARRTVEAAAGKARSVRVKDVAGELLFPSRQAIPETLEKLEIPLVSPGTGLEPPWGDVLCRLLASEGISQKDLRVPGLRRPFFGEALRPLFLTARNTVFSALEEDELYSTPARRFFARRLEMDLPRGAYATVVLRALGQ
ncbi:MAG: tRNA pseudouridine(13) synthase TruD [Acidobacteria bacterium]|nr:tRNA pseudouridine(13) synthase TruD [Acidobacteriota bacterium]